MSAEYPEQRTFAHHGAWYWNWKRRNGRWGGVTIHRMASFESRGGTIRISGYGRNLDDGPYLDVLISDAGRSLTVWQDGKRLVPEEST